MLTYKDLKPEQKGPWVFKLLGGKAWDACEHLSLDKLSSAEREAKIWKLLEPHFPEKKPYDQMGEALGAIFALAAKDGEDLKSWTGRVRDTFDQCQRKGNVNFPPEAKGWILLHCAGMSEEQRATVEAKSQGQLDLNWRHKLFGREYKASTNRKRPLGSIKLTRCQMSEAITWIENGSDFKGVEAFLSEYQATPDDLGDLGTLTEEDAAEALAVSWSEQRREIAKLKQSR